VFKKTFQKPDGRALILYAREPIPEDLKATSPSQTPVDVAKSHLRWHPLRGEWVSYASHRQDRTFLPPKDFNPLAPTTSTMYPTELPAGRYDVAVFENMFPALSLKSTDAPLLPGIKTLPAKGVCEVVVFSQNPDIPFGKLPLSEIDLILEVWGDRTKELGKNKDIMYVMPFENRGVEVGVTLHHPHSQIYAYPSVPPIALRELKEQKLYYEAQHRGLLNDFWQNEERAEIRMLYNDDCSVAFVPACARYPYEAWVLPKRAVPTLGDLTATERTSLARALKTVLLKYDGLWNRPFPYLMVVHQAPTDAQAHPEAHLHFEFYPPYRTETKLKYLAGTEIGAGFFANDSFPEEKAAELRAVEVNLD
jgi:UDPglucose--hexose-1-phosphate uridylyltransferase